jgi:hypothetical protein
MEYTYRVQYEADLYDQVLRGGYKDSDNDGVSWFQKEQKMNLFRPKPSKMEIKT